jgi:hypothetical protein
MIPCAQCGKDTELVGFATYTGRDGTVRRRRVCLTCRNRHQEDNFEKLQAWRKDYNLRTRSKRHLQHHERRQIAKRFVDEAKKGPCADCGGTFPPVAMDFDHVRGAKARNVSGLVSGAYKIALIELEIAKCDLVCACCHRVRTAARRDNVGVKRLRGRPPEVRSELTPETPRVKGQAVAGERNANAKITAVQAREIVDLRKSGEALRTIAGVYGLSIAAVSHIVKGRTWARVTTMGPS